MYIRNIIDFLTNHNAPDALEYLTQRCSEAILDTQQRPFTFEEIDTYYNDYFREFIECAIESRRYDELDPYEIRSLPAFIRENIAKTTWLLFYHLVQKRMGDKFKELYDSINKKIPNPIGPRNILSLCYNAFDQNWDDLTYCFDADNKNSLYVYLFADTVNWLFEKQTEKPSATMRRCLSIALEAIDKMIKQEKGFAYIYYLKANFLFLQMKEDRYEKEPIETIRELLKKAIREESSSNAGLRRQSDYLLKLTEIDGYEMRIFNKQSESDLQQLAAENKQNLKTIEANSIKKFSAFSAFVSFAVGLLSKFMSSGTLLFNETVGYFLMLFGIAVGIFAIMDLIVLGPLSDYYDRKLYADRRSIILFSFRAIIEIALCVGAVALGILFGKGII